MNKSQAGVSLVELLIAIVLLSVLVMGFFSLDLFTRYHLISSERRSSTQNEVSYLMEHISKNIALTIGNERISGSNTVVNVTLPTGGNERTRVQFYIHDPASAQDYWMCYRHYGGDTDYPNQLQYCSRCGSNPPCAACTSGWQTLSSNVTDFLVTKPGGDILSENFLTVTLTGCWNPSKTKTTANCGDPDNPTVTMHNNVRLPSVSTH